MRNRFDRQLEQLSCELIEMGALIEQAIASAAKALTEQDKDAAKKAIAFDSEVDEKEKEIEALCLKLLLHQQPVAGDLRLISSALKMITDMERIGDQAADISELVVLMDGMPYAGAEHIPEMARATIGMVTDSIDAFVRRDMELARRVCADDDRVDALFDRVKGEIVALIHQNADDGERAVDLLMVAKYFERIGDHAVNLAEWVIFSITGQHMDPPSKEEESR